MRASTTVTGAFAAIVATLLALTTGVGATPSAVLLARDGHHEHMPGGPWTKLNETDLLLKHSATPPSYYTADLEGEGVASGQSRHPGLMGLHVGLMCLAFFVALPAGIALRSVKHSWHSASVVLFWATSILGVAAGGLYRKLTPNMYEGATHAFHSYFVLLVAAVLTTVDALSLLQRLLAYVISLRSGRSSSFAPLWRIDSRQDAPTSEYAKLAHDEDDDTVELRSPDEEEWSNNTPARTSADSQRTVFGRHSLNGPKLTRHGSNNSDSTLGDDRVPTSDTSTSRWIRFGRGLFNTTERVLVFAAFGQLLEGVVVYSGGCRQNYINGCLAHLIKGGIFWAYGLASFARFLGAFSDRGWAWNQVPDGRKRVSAEFVESTVIFVYGATQVWMERFGAQPGDPWTTRQIQHTSIAAMFGFAGLVGMGLESTRVRGWLAAAAASKSREQSVVAPASYRGSFNPFPALIIGCTGAVMSAHEQPYLFQVQIHELWGRMLLAFAVLRCLTYFFGWLAPPASVLPSRPPTEALGSFFLACGGLVFMLSVEDVTIAAMRRGRDDVMMFLNLTVAVTCFAFLWTMGVVTLKGWLQSRSGSRPDVVPA